MLRWSYALFFTSLVGCGPSLYSSAFNGDVAAVKEKLANGGNPNELDNGGLPLCAALNKSHTDVVIALLDAKADPNGDCGLSPAKIAFYKGDSRSLAALFAHGATLGSRESLFGIDKSDAKTAEVYLAHVERTAGRARVSELLDEESSQWWTPLSQAAYSGDAALLRVMIAHGADPNREARMVLDPKHDAWPILFFAKGSGNEEAVKVLLKAGADPTAKTKLGRTFAEAIGPVREAEAKAREDQAESDARWAAVERASREEERQDERERAQRERSRNEDFVKRVTGQTPSNNPLDDNSFQERMRAQAQAQTPRPSSTSAPSPAPAANAGDPTSKAASSAVAGGKDDDAKKKEEERKAAAEARKRDAAEKAAKDKADREASEAAAKEAAAQKRAAYLEANRRGIRLKAGTCPGSKDYHVIGTRPDQNLCINVTYRATCATNQGASTGVLRNFTGGGSCGGDTQVIAPKPSCKVEEVTVTVDDVQPCGP